MDNDNFLDSNLYPLMNEDIDNFKNNYSIAYKEMLNKTVEKSESKDIYHSIITTKDKENDYRTSFPYNEDPYASFSHKKLEDTVKNGYVVEENLDNDDVIHHTNAQLHVLEKNDESDKDKEVNRPFMWNFIEYQEKEETSTTNDILIRNSLNLRAAQFSQDIITFNFYYIPYCNIFIKNDDKYQEIRVTYKGKVYTHDFRIIAGEEIKVELVPRFHQEDGWFITTGELNFKGGIITEDTTISATPSNVNQSFYFIGFANLNREFLGSRWNKKYFGHNENIKFVRKKVKFPDFMTKVAVCACNTSAIWAGGRGGHLHIGHHHGNDSDQYYSRGYSGDGLIKGFVYPYAYNSEKVHTISFKKTLDSVKDLNSDPKVVFKKSILHISGGDNNFDQEITSASLLGGTKFFELTQMKLWDDLDYNKAVYQFPFNDIRVTYPDNTPVQKDVVERMATNIYPMYYHIMKIDPSITYDFFFATDGYGKGRQYCDFIFWNEEIENNPISSIEYDSINPVMRNIDIYHEE
jgi:hypothetical protein